MSKIILYGDSILGGFQNGQLTNTITNQIQSAFPKDLIINQSIAGATSVVALDNLEDLVLRNQPNIVVLNFGVNDATVNNGMSAGRFNNNLNHLIERIGPKKVILIGPSYTNWKKAVDQSWPRILQFELVVEHVSHKYKLPFLDLAKVMQEKNANAYLQTDGIHFNEAGNELLVTNLIPLIKETKQKNKR